MSISCSEHQLSKLYTLAGIILSHVPEAKYLAVTLSEDLKWGKHIQYITTEANNVLGSLHRNTYHSPEKLCEQTFISLVHSKLEYIPAAWDTHLALVA